MLGGFGRILCVVVETCMGMNPDLWYVLYLLLISVVLLRSLFFSRTDGLRKGKMWRVSSIIVCFVVESRSFWDRRWDEK